MTVSQHDAAGSALEPSPHLHDALLARGRRLEQLTIAWNVLEVFVAIGLGVAARSLALVAFGLDSLVEVFASVVVIAYIGQHHAAGRARRAMRLVAVAFTVLGVLLLVASIHDFVQGGGGAGSSSLGVVYLALTACVMFGLALEKRRIARAAQSRPLGAEASVTFLDGWLASSVLLALVVNEAWGIAWVDPVAALVVALFSFRGAIVNWSASRSSTVGDLS